MTASMRQLVRQFRDAMKCEKCGKSLLVSNTSGYRQKFRAEPVTPATHCNCPGSPMAKYMAEERSEGAAR
jgi:hypothetical protein